MYRHLLALAVLILSLLVACVAPTPTIAPAGPLKVTLLHTNDMHGYLEGQMLTGSDGKSFEFGGLPHALGTIARLKREAAGPVLLFDTGDLWVGTLASNRDQGKTIIAAMNAIGYDAMTLGNHDFDQGVAVVQARASEARFPILIANIVEASSGKVPGWAKAYIVKEIAGIRFGIIGVAYARTPGISSKVKELQAFKFIDELETLRQILPEVKRQADVIIVLSHAGFDADQRIAEALPDINVIVGGHTHTELRTPKVIGNTIIVQAGARAQHIGRLELTIDRASKRIVDYTRNNLLVAVVSNKAETPQDIAAMFDKLIAEGRTATRRVIGETAIDLLRAYTPDGRTSGEHPAGNLVVDAMLWANQAGDTPADVAIHNNAGIRADIPRGPITYGQLYEMLPFDNVLVAMDLKGEHIKAVLEVAASCPRVNTLVAGMSFTYNCALPAGNRISNILIRGKPMELQKVYRVQTIDYLANGGDGQVAFKEGTNLIYGDPVVDVVAAYIMQNSPVRPRVEGRIVEAR